MKTHEWSDDPFVHVEDWPAIPGQCSEVNKKQHAWIGALVKELASMKRQLEDVVQRNAELENRVKELEKSDARPQRNFNGRHKIR